jgi:hypothetical protein
VEEDGPDVSVLHYTARAVVGGKIAQLGARLLDASAAKVAAEFFARFGEIVRNKSASS